MLRSKAIDHVGLVVGDLDRSLRFYTEALGLELLRRSPATPDRPASAVLKIGGQEINLFCRPDLVAGPAAERHGVHHFCFAVEEPTIDDVIGALRQAGVAIARGPVEFRGGTSVFVDDPDGIRVELTIKREPPG